ncbi:hypothetical protein OBBRIDRAFT_808590 [Obba rivulosa]|uniref:Uncharacterized protein n=1 Tax=Obba rivulosa TaxID=1052685 RepID=A0A8E2AL48_9APHY|nr:hypothetical protein OBBRIDRAFT_808590 [Obba rivulosa]
MPSSSYEKYATLPILYCRHAEARKAYQRRYNAITRVGRRKNTLSRQYSNDILRKEPLMDPQRPLRTCDAEESLWHYLLNEMQSSKQPLDDYVPWRASIAKEVAQEVASGLVPEEHLHVHRRMVAIQHQFLDLLTQGPLALSQAEMDVALISQGRWLTSRHSVNLTFLKRNYGF